MLNPEERQFYWANVEFACSGCFESIDEDGNAGELLRNLMKTELELWGQACLDSGVDVGGFVKALELKCDRCIAYEDKNEAIFKTHSCGISSGHFEFFGKEVVVAD